MLIAADQIHHRTVLGNKATDDACLPLSTPSRYSVRAKTCALDLVGASRCTTRGAARTSQAKGLHATVRSILAGTAKPTIPAQSLALVELLARNAQMTGVELCQGWAQRQLGIARTAQRL